MMSKNIPTIIITGPTASGKTKLSLELAKNNNGEIINADIMQMYEGFNILKAMPSTEEKFEVKHYLFGVIKKETKFTVADWIKLAKDKIYEIHKKGKVPIEGIKVTTDGDSTIITDFGDGTCDSLVEVTKDGEIETVDLKDIKRGDLFKNILKSKNKKK